MVGVVIAEEYFLRLYFELGLGSVGGKGLRVGDGLREMPGVFGEGYFLVHAVCDFLVVDLLLYV